MATRRNDTGPSEDAIEMLKADHQKVRDLFQDYENAQDQRAKHKIAPHSSGFSGAAAQVHTGSRPR
jgi:hypothetical protein